MFENIMIVDKDTVRGECSIDQEAAHCFVFAKDDGKFLTYDKIASILVQVRFDGTLGFPGGLVDEGENDTQAVNRELVEEANFDIKKYPVTQDNYVVCFYNPSRKLLNHFYAIEISLQDFENLEHRIISNKDYGFEVWGTCRVPLYTMKNNCGFPAFLRNNFAPCAKEQLLYTLKHLNILSKAAIDATITSVTPN